MRIAVIMPVYRRVATACNATACFLLQTLPADCEATLFVIDDGDTFSDLGFGSLPPREVALWKRARRFSTLAGKYNAAIDEIARDYQPDVVALFDDDDVYLPWHLGVHAEMLRGKRKAWSKPSQIWTDYHGEPRLENAAGRFHGSIAFTGDVESRWDETAGPDFDQRFMAALRQECGEPADPLTACAKPSYVFRWHTGHYHGQQTMDRPGNAWYEAISTLVPEAPRAILVPQLDPFTHRFLTNNTYHEQHN